MTQGVMLFHFQGRLVEHSSESRSRLSLDRLVVMRRPMEFTNDLESENEWSGRRRNKWPASTPIQLQSFATQFAVFITTTRLAAIPAQAIIQVHAKETSSTDLSNQTSVNCST